MTNAERTQMLQRYTDLLNRLDDLNTIEENTKSLFDKDLRETISSIINETKSELSKLKDLIDKKREYLFNFKSGGWNTATGYTVEEAIEQARNRWADNDSLAIDEKSFRESDPESMRAALSLFY